MERVVITAIALAVPAFVYSWLVQTIDRYEKEPVRYLLGAFAWGAVPAIVLALIAQIILSVPIASVLGAQTFESQLTQAAIAAPVTEEIVKGMAVWFLYLKRRHEFDGWVDGIVYGAMAGFGFAYVENIFYLLSKTSTWEEWLSLYVVRAIVFGGLHGFWTALVGIGFGIARYRHDTRLKVGAIALGLIFAIAGHLIHNGAISMIQITSGATLPIALFNYFILAIVMLLLWFVAGYLDRRRLRLGLKEEVPSVISPRDYDALCSIRSNRWELVGMNPRQRRAFVQAAAELAQKKMQLRTMGDEEGNQLEIARLRDELQQLGDRA